jgi:hypothetical protein
MSLFLSLLLVLADPPAPPPKAPKPDKLEGKLSTETPRRPNPLAPSLPELTDDEEKKFDAIIDRFIEADSGQLKGPDAKKAIEEFKGLGPESFFALVRGLNKAARIDHSCPAVTIARKLTGILRSSNDPDLLQYAKENIGLGVKQSRHMDVLKELKFTSNMRLNSLKGGGRSGELRSVP